MVHNPDTNYLLSAYFRIIHIKNVILSQKSNRYESFFPYYLVFPLFYITTFREWIQLFKVEFPVNGKRLIKK